MGAVIDFETDPLSLFEILEPLGEGSYGRVSKAKNKKTNKLVAIKFLPMVASELDSL